LDNLEFMRSAKHENFLCLDFLYSLVEVQSPQSFLSSRLRRERRFTQINADNFYISALICVLIRDLVEDKMKKPLLTKRLPKWTRKNASRLAAFGM